MGVEEVEEELEVLRSIYDDRIEVADTTRVRIGGIVGQGVGIALDMELPVEYPSGAVPDVSVSIVSGRLSGGTDALLRVVREEAERQMGIPMIFALVSAAEEWLAAQASGGATAKASAPQPDEALEDGAPLSNGPLLTSEAFMAWWPSFRDNELRRIIAAEEDVLWAREHPGETVRPLSVVEASAAHPPKSARAGTHLTGKQLFEQGRVRIADAAGAEDEPDALEDLSALDATAFEGLDSLDIQDDS